ncbi:MAG: DUF3078 domain-containing protein [Chitinophagaceae bacterium]|nr:MAG: DUF3078 domain-containing protein [Chitinophagaceae bacterium]
MRLTLLSIFAALSITAMSQDQTVTDLKNQSSRTIKKDAADTTVKTWKKGGVYGINVSQGSLSNWAAGGDDFSLSVNSVLSLFAFYKEGKHSWDNTLDFNLGYVNTTSLGSRKNDDRFDVLSKYGYALNSKLNVAGLFNFRSQLFKGYTYSDDSKTLSSNFLAPAYVLLSPGLDWKPVDGLSIFVSPSTVRWTIVKDDSLSSVGAYGVEPGKTVETEIGAFATVNYLKQFNSIVSYKGRLDLFANYRRNPQNVDINFTNVINVKLSRILNLTYSLDMIYDDDVRLFGETEKGARMQLKSIVGLGLQVRF